MNWGHALGRQPYKRGLKGRHHSGRGSWLGQNFLCRLHGRFHGKLSLGHWQTVTTAYLLTPNSLISNYHLHSWNPPELRTNPSGWRACICRGQCPPRLCWRSGQVGEVVRNYPKALMHTRLPPQIQDRSPETWRGEGYASNSRGEQGAGREEGPGSTEHLSQVLRLKRGLLFFRGTKAHVTVGCTTFACTFILPTPTPRSEYSHPGYMVGQP